MSILSMKYSRYFSINNKYNISINLASRKITMRCDFSESRMYTTMVYCFSSKNKKKKKKNMLILF